MAGAETSSPTRVGVDIGGTFTDVAAIDSDGRLSIGKRLTSHGSEHEGVLQAVLGSGADIAVSNAIVAHGTTLVINSLLERKGARTAFVTTRGFGDLLEIGRGNRSENFTLRFHRQGPLVSPDLRYEFEERTAPDGSVEQQPTEEAITALIAWIRDKAPESLAIGFLHSYANPANELLIAERLAAELPGLTITASSSLSRQWREYERFTTATANAFVAPVVDRYLQRIVSGLAAEGFRGEFVVLDSSGGGMTAANAARFPVRIVESGPVGGVIAARTIASRLEIPSIVTFDVGGTTAKSALVEDSGYTTQDIYWIGGEGIGFPLQVNTVDIVEVGVGGGSIASFDSGRLRLGPRSAGSQPGPVCFGLGGTEVTLTDANLYCGRIDPEHFSGEFPLDRGAAAQALEALAAKAGMTTDRLALGIIELANLTAAATVRQQTLERGRDPRDYVLLASGGGGPLHVCAVATEVGMKRIIVPRHPGHFSALGMLQANLRVNRREIFQHPIDTLSPAMIRAAVTRIAEELRVELDSEGASTGATMRFGYALAIRFAGQEHALWVGSTQTGLTVLESTIAELRATFEQEYVRRYGHLDVLSHVETAEIEVVAERDLPSVEIAHPEAVPGRERVIETLWDQRSGRVPTRVIARNSIEKGARVEGPLIVHEAGATMALPPGAVAEVLDDGTILIDLNVVE